MTRPSPAASATALDEERHRRGDGHEVARARERERLIELRAHPAPVALRQAQELAQEERQADGRHQHLLAASMAERNEDRPRRGEAPARRDRGREREGRGQERGGRPADHRQGRDRRRIAAGRGHFAEGEIDPPDQAVDQRIGRRQEPIDRRQRQPVERHLQSIGERMGHDGEAR